MSSRTIGDKYKLGKRIAKGSFGLIRRGTDLQTKKKVAIKLERTKSKQCLLPQEAEIASILSKTPGFPRLNWFGSAGRYNAMVLDLLGPSLSDLFESCHQKFTTHTVCRIAEQTLTRLEHMHSFNYLHRDLKPQNLVIGRKTQANTVFLIDFGLAKQFKSEQGHIPYREGKSLIGTSRYAALNAHLGIQQGRRDDLESLGYVLVYFLKGRLPWQDLKVPKNMDRDDLIRDVKASISIDTLCEALPEEFSMYFRHCRSLRFEECPQYAYLRQLFKGILSKTGAFRLEFDWSHKKQNKLKDRGSRRSMPSILNKVII